MNMQIGCSLDNNIEICIHTNLETRGGHIIELAYTAIAAVYGKKVILLFIDLKLIAPHIDPFCWQASTYLFASRSYRGNFLLHFNQNFNLQHVCRFHKIFNDKL